MIDGPGSPGDTSALSGVRCAHVALRVADRDAAVSWYRDKLGMRVTRAFELHRMVFTEMAMAGDERFRLELVSGEGARDRSGSGGLVESFALHGWHHLALWVDDVDKAVGELKDREVDVILDPTENDEWRVRVAFFTDPSGNVIELMQAMGS